MAASRARRSVLGNLRDVDEASFHLPGLGSAGHQGRIGRDPGHAPTLHPKLPCHGVVEGPRSLVPIEPDRLDPVGRGHAVDLFRLVEVGLPGQLPRIPEPGGSSQLHHVVEGHLATDLIGEEPKGFVRKGGFERLRALGFQRAQEGDKEVRQQNGESEKGTNTKRTHGTSP